LEDNVFIITGKGIKRFLKARARLERAVADPHMNFSAWNVKIRGSRWWIDGPRWLDPFLIHIFSRPADKIASIDRKLIEQLQNRCGYQRMLAGDALVASTPGASVISLNDFTLHKSPEIYYTEPSHLRVRYAYQTISNRCMKSGELPENACTRVELYSKQEFQSFSEISKFFFVQFLIEQVVRNRFSVYLVDVDQKPPTPQSYDLFDNHVTNFKSTPSIVWQSSDTYRYPSIESVEGEVDKKGIHGVAGRVEEYGKLFGEPLSGMAAADICNLLDFPLVDTRFAKWLPYYSGSFEEIFLLEPNISGVGVRLSPLIRWLKSLFRK
jgi:hypothetical protein